MIRGIVVLLFCGTIIAAFSSSLFTSIYGHVRSEEWVQTKALVTNINELNKSAILIYRYMFNNTEFTGDNFAFLSSGSVPDKYLILSNYQVGDEIDVYVNPSDPKESVVLKREVLLEHFSTHVLVIIITLIIGYFIGIKNNENLKMYNETRGLVNKAVGQKMQDSGNRK